MGDVVSQVIGEEAANTLLTSEIDALTYDDFITLIGQLNNFAKEFLTSDGYQTVFAVKKNTDSTMFWKSTVQIACVRVDTNITQKLLKYRLLNLNEFYKVFKTIQSQVVAAEHSKSNSIKHISDLEMLLDTVDATTSSEQQQDNQSECIICFERKQEVILPCAHSFCNKCIEEWNDTSETCPICREKLHSPSDAWVLSEFPECEEIGNEIRGSLIELSEEKPQSCKTC